MPASAPSPLVLQPSREAPLAALRERVAAIGADGGARALEEARRPVPLGHAGADAALGGGLARGGLHELRPAAPGARGGGHRLRAGLRSPGFSGRRGSPGCGCGRTSPARETGEPYGPGLACFGLDPVAAAARRRSRRAGRAARGGGGAALRGAGRRAGRALGRSARPRPHRHAPARAGRRGLRRQRPVLRSGGHGGRRRRGDALAGLGRAQPGAAAAGPWPALGRPAFAATLLRCRQTGGAGEGGRWIMEWDPDERRLREPCRACAAVVAPAPAQRPAAPHRPAGAPPSAAPADAAARRGGKAARRAARSPAWTPPPPPPASRPAWRSPRRAPCIPALAVAEADPAADAALLDAVADWAERYTPFVGLQPADGLVLDIGGSAHLFGGEEGLLRDLLRRLGRAGLSRARRRRRDGARRRGRWPASRRRARAAGRAAGRRGARPCRRLPVAALGLDAGGTRRRSDRLGLKRVGDLAARAARPAGRPLRQRLLDRLDRALGRAGEPISPRRPLPACMAERRFAEPIGHEDDVRRSILSLAGDLAQRAGAPRRGRAAAGTRLLPRRRGGAPPRRGDRPAAARSRRPCCASSASGSRRWPIPSTPASAST